MIYWYAYWDLSDTRRYNEVGIQPLDIPTILGYADLTGTPRGEPALRLYRFIRAMDSAHRDWWSDQQKKNNKKK